MCRRGANALCGLTKGGALVGTHPLSIMQGQTDESSARFTIVSNKNVPLTYVVLTLKNDDNLKIHQILEPRSSSSREFSSWRVDQLLTTDLDPKQKYELWVIGSEGKLWDRRIFAALDTKNKYPKIVVTSCMDDSFVDVQEKAWKKVVETQPDLLFLIGDNVYVTKKNMAEVTDPHVIWERYVQTRNSLYLFKILHLIPIQATWDDNDYGKNNGDRGFLFKEESRLVFETFFPQPEKKNLWIKGPGVSGILNLFNSHFVFLDNRSFRSPNQLDWPDQTHLGEEQEAWLFHFMQNAQKPLWLLSGDQFFGGYHNFESYEGSHPKSFIQFKSEFKKFKVPVVFLSGGRHLFEIMKINKKDIGQNTFEFTSSGIHSLTYANAIERNPNPRRVMGISGPYNFMEINLLPSLPQQRLRMTVKAWGVDQGMLYKKDFSFK